MAYRSKLCSINLLTAAGKNISKKILDLQIIHKTDLSLLIDIKLTTMVSI